MEWTPEDVSKLAVIAMMLLPLDVMMIALAIHWLRE